MSNFKFTAWVCERCDMGQVDSAPHHEIPYFRGRDITVCQQCYEGFLEGCEAQVESASEELEK